MSHASMLKARRQHQKNKKLIAGAAKEAKRLEKQALAGPVVKKEKVKKVKVKKEKVPAEEATTKKKGGDKKSGADTGKKAAA